MNYVMIVLIGLVATFFIKNGPMNLFLTILILGFVSFSAYNIAENNIGAETLEHEDGVSLRQDSNTIGTKSIFIFYNRRSHMGGGLAGGK